MSETQIKKSARPDAEQNRYDERKRDQIPRITKALIKRAVKVNDGEEYNRERIIPVSEDYRNGYGDRIGRVVIEDKDNKRIHLDYKEVPKMRRNKDDYRVDSPDLKHKSDRLDHVDATIQVEKVGDAQTLEIETEIRAVADYNVDPNVFEVNDKPVGRMILNGEDGQSRYDINHPKAQSATAEILAKARGKIAQAKIDKVKSDEQ